jgi:hypothetical protein
VLQTAAALPKETAKEWSQEWVKGIADKLPKQLLGMLALSAAAACSVLRWSCQLPQRQQ